MLKKILFVCLLGTLNALIAQTPTDYLSGDFHKNRREILRSKMPKNSVAVVFANPIRNRANDVDYVFHQDPNFYYLTGYREPNAVLVLFSENQTDASGKTYNEVLYVQKNDLRAEMWNGKRLGIEGAKKELGFKIAKNAEDFISDKLNFKKFDKVFIEKFKDDYRNSERNKAEIYDLVNEFKNKSGYSASSLLSKEKRYVYELIKSTPIENSANVAQVIGKAITYYPSFKNDELLMGYKNATNNKLKKEFQEKAAVKLNLKSNIDLQFLPTRFAEMREVKTPEEMKLLTKAIRISAIGQIEMMKAMKPEMSETEIQGIHEFVYKKYGAEYEGYPSIVGAGNNGCILHYIENNKTRVNDELVLMDLGAEYRGYTADVTRTIPANGKFSPEQKAIYNIVLKAQDAGIAVSKVGNQFWQPGQEAKQVINQGLLDLGIIKSLDEKHMYFPHGTSHHIGLDVHDPGTYGKFQENMVITVEPGIYIPEGSKCDKKWWGIAVRIEDDILITKNGPVNLSEEAPRTVKAIEKMMAKKSVLNDFVLPNLD
ncbi:MULTISPECIES: aminopeptidase P family protein [unclassified Tenacibaculum]|uniref:aminopeptidase P family protein n=1 Tax=unclassified Tenacibaculum TaxID=2635139 RepID=UPI001F1AD226|nr:MULTISPECIES: aminopeptidase P family protein [unclassified Tenacibaculum]MCF2873886.1 aminopeptidase P N-terminal domain-containing protein [Tenacibaculum sp. Cn5-1]MCF2936696.1 aminopeptidase P N-terminal domain-containing protein [Tenacibaculum sp. Cn5-34]MCG7512920.1 aminopeptidase P N-terminal domain-containing protein [Tenacibaculum sp. Cn5-46]